ncbi:MAG TPA: potassium transporter KefA [Clostridiales bacterium]|nr:potassium transporter KefA [Clostridiales bacterium]
MNYAIVTRVLGKLFSIEALLMIPSLIAAIVYKDQKDIMSFVSTMLILLVVGSLMSLVKPEDKRLHAREGMVIVTVGWIMVSFFGSLPFVFSGSIPSVTNAFFESVSGFTTTGATILNDVEAMPKGNLFWRAFTNWIGGMGILVFTLALLPAMGISGLQIYKAETTGPVTDKIMPKMRDTARMLYITYGVFSLLPLVLLLLGGMSFYDACVHTFGTVGTGGFSSRQASVGAYDSTYIHMVIGVFMMFSGVNFSLYYALYKNKWRDVIKDQELRLYLFIVLGSTLLVAADLFLRNTSGLGLSLRDAYFQVSSIITTTGYTTVDYDQWSTFSKLILLALMFIGGCAGSTAGGIKNIRILVLLKLVKREISKIFHPRAVIPVKVGDKTVPEDTLLGITAFTFLYVLVFLAGTLIVSTQGVSFLTAVSSVASAIGNIGPGMDAVGPSFSYSVYNDFNKWVLSLLMLLGRLELFTMIGVIVPGKWRNE